METIKVLVTGAGSTVGQGVIKALRSSNLPLYIVASDISPFNCALYRADKGIILPRVEEENSLERSIAGIKANNIDVVMLGFALTSSSTRGRKGIHFRLFYCIPAWKNAHLR